ncbi:MULTISPECIES: NADH-quinone oxidoreductase subunit J [Azospirillum]|uniref:NADH-quinone oxidoreductase subunit J n=2 Tax=Azospirillum TaxID=191 RepID=A0A235H8M2_AZOBR|nr:MULTISPECIES: NADH-quinone oxidoreductase subunit J [Azospirillum]AWJ83093.1 NADH:ubiquinone oxidoreductase subunit J [Azospirillum sp. TSH58]MBY3752772.1 NADH-quinone oxidoreductase subunit J [Azospirillum formosense]NUB18268.1 NADH-quinone oxidoreductase subunit J [Azospirillum formosense]OYD81803.1 NADH:ubiquinone oxidoreductase subunit J [Azospirillum brasilense]PWC63320.1 NADH:ubiquinone oxidoreductase subunit J [Azospirillum sp. TSH58]
MIVQGIAFYVFAALLVASGVMVISARNPVHSVLYLVLAFFQAAGLCVLLGAEFIAMILVIVYVGAVAVLFLFVVMMLDINFRELRAGALQYLPIGGLIGLILLAELAAVLGGWIIAPAAEKAASAPVAAMSGATNTEQLGQLIYTHYVYLFQASGLVLLIAMIGAIVLTLRQREGVRKQNIGSQLARRREDVVAIRKVPTGEGV